MTHLHIDTETFSEADLGDVGTSRYARHASTELLMAAYSFGDGEIKQWVPAEGEAMPDDLRAAFSDPTITFFAWNKTFEYNIFKHVLGIEVPHHRWKDPMVVAFGLSLPGSLGGAGAVVDLPTDKQKSTRGKALIRRFCIPRKPTKGKPWTRATKDTDPAEWAEFRSYNVQDVEAERAIWRRIRKFDMPAHEQRLWELDQVINEKGIPINLKVVHNAIAVYKAVVEKRLAEMKEITGLANPNSNVQLLPWLREAGYPYYDLVKGHVARAFEAAEPGSTLRRVLELRLEVNKSSVKKYQALADATDDDGCLRNALQFAGAGRTWRWAGRKFQVQNLAKPVWYLRKPEAQAAAVHHLEHLDAESIELIYDKPMDLLSTCVRPVVQAPEGYTFVDADLSAIENVVLGFIAECDKILRVFREGRDPYIHFSTFMFGGSYDTRWAEYDAGNKEKRTLSKPAVLGCGYMLGPGEQFENEKTGEIQATGLLGYAWNMGVRQMTPEQSKIAVKVWRDTFSEVKDFWWALDKAARRCIQTHEPQRVGHITFDISGPFMRMGLPSGRHLHYCRPRIQDERAPWGDIVPTITYEGLNEKNQWTRLTTHPGKICENADQAIARDILAHGMTLARSRGLDIRFHVHDQAIALVRQRNAERALKILIDSLAEPPKWAPDLPLSAKGIISKIFLKDD